MREMHRGGASDKISTLLAQGWLHLIIRMGGVELEWGVVGGTTYVTAGSCAATSYAWTSWLSGAEGVGLGLRCWRLEALVR